MTKDRGAETRSSEEQVEAAVENLRLINSLAQQSSRRRRLPGVSNSLLRRVGRPFGIIYDDVVLTERGLEIEYDGMGFFGEPAVDYIRVTEEMLREGTEPNAGRIIESLSKFSKEDLEIILKT